MLDTIVLDNEITFNSLEKEIYNIACKMACNVLTQVLEDMDKKISKERDKKEYRHKGYRTTTLKTLMGEVTFLRAVYKNIDNEGNKRFIYFIRQRIRS